MKNLEFKDGSLIRRYRVRLVLERIAHRYNSKKPIWKPLREEMCFFDREWEAICFVNSGMHVGTKINADREKYFPKIENKNASNVVRKPSRKKIATT